MRAGRLNQSIQIQRATEATDDFGQTSKTWTPLSTVRAEVKTALETENQSGGKYDGRTRYNILIRYTDITKKDRIVWDSKNLEVVEVIDLSRRRTDMKILAVSDE